MFQSPSVCPQLQWGQEFIHFPFIRSYSKYRDPYQDCLCLCKKKNPIDIFEYWSKKVETMHERVKSCARSTKYWGTLFTCTHCTFQFALKMQFIRFVSLASSFWSTEAQKKEQREAQFFLLFISYWVLRGPHQSSVSHRVTLHLLYHCALRFLLRIIKSSLLSSLLWSRLLKRQKTPEPFAAAPTVVMETHQVPHMAY